MLVKMQRHGKGVFQPFGASQWIRYGLNPSSLREEPGKSAQLESQLSRCARDREIRQCVRAIGSNSLLLTLQAQDLLRAANIDRD
jgi:hypothetical protein